MIDCLSTLVGATERECDCLPESLPDGFDPAASESGIYLDDIVNLNLAKAGCGDENVWARILRMRTKAIIDFETTLSAELLKTHRATQGWGGRIGKEAIATQEVVGDRFGVELHVRQHRGAYLTIKSIKLKLSGTGQTPVFRFTDGNGNQVAEPVTGAAYIASGQWQTYTLTTPVRLPLWDEGDSTLIYRVFHDQDEFVNNQVDCAPCSGGPLPYEKYVKPYGIFSANGGSTWNTNGYQHGMTLMAEVSCGLDYALCSASSDLARMAAAVCVQHLWAVNIIDDIVNDPEPSRWTTLSKDDLKATRDYFMRKGQTVKMFASDSTDDGPFWANMRLLIASLNYGHCFSCNPVISRQTISK